jgi:hypothetical protein
VNRVHIVLEEVAELKRSMTENTGLKELQEQFARLTSSVKVLENIPQKKEFRLVNKHTTHTLIAGKGINPYSSRPDGSSFVGMNYHGVCREDCDIWTLEPVD